MKQRRFAFLLEKFNVKDKRKLFMAGQKAAETLESARNHRDLSSWGRRKSRKIFSRRLSGHQELLKGKMRRGRFVRDKGQLEVGNDTIDNGRVCEILKIFLEKYYEKGSVIGPFRA
jgi:hypothetical protein